MERRRDMLLAIVLGCLAFAWYVFFAPPGIPPEMWGEVSVSASLRAPHTVFPGLARHLAALLFGCFDFGTACNVIALLGKILAAASVGFSYRILRYVLRSAGTPLEVATPRRRLIGEAICVVVTVMFALSEAMLETSEALTVDSLALFLSLAALVLFFRFLDRGGVLVGGLMLFCFGVVTAETPSGFLLVAVAVVLYLLAIRGMTGFIPRPPSVYLREIFKWWATLAFAVGFFGVVALNLGRFVACGGLEANGVNLLGAVLRYLTRYGEICRETATATGWFLVGVAVVFPLVLVLALLPRAHSDEKFISWGTGMCYVFAGLFSAVQLGTLNVLWFRTWTNAPCMNSHYLVNFCGLLSAITLVMSLAVVAIESFVRDHRLIVERMADDAVVAPVSRMGVRIRRICLAVLIPSALILLAWPVGAYHVRREMRAILDAAVAEIVREAGDAKWIFTDGVLDDGIEVAALASRTNRIYSLAMMGREDDYARYVRLRGGVAEEDRRSLELSSADAFRDWVMVRPERVEESAFMLGFEMWRAAGRPEPTGSGFLARSVHSEGERARGVDAARVLAERMLAFCDECSPKERASAGALLNRYFSVVLWRMSRLGVFRADAAERAADERSADAERELAKRLDAANPFLEGVRNLQTSLAENPRRRVSMREKLKLALMRADFSSASKIADVVLEGDPRNVDALFAKGMKDYFAGNYVRAEIHLRKAADAQPRNGVVWNNLAMCQMKLGKLDEAEHSAKIAVGILKGSTEAANTLMEVKRAKEARASICAGRETMAKK